MKEKQPHIVWEDHDHAYAWAPVFAFLMEQGFKVTVFGYLKEDMQSERERLLNNADLYIVHSGTINPPDLSERIIAIKKGRDIKILLQAEAVNELTKPHIDGVISVYDMLHLEELKKRLIKVLAS